METVKFVAFADIHGSAVFAEKLAALAKAKKADAFLCAGDISNFDSDWEEPVEKLGGLKIPVFFVRGNHEEEKTAEAITKKSRYFQDISYKTVKFKGIEISGLPATYPLDAPDAGKLLQPGQAPQILITHMPPMNTACDVERDGSHSGCPHVREAILKIKPEAVICGHYHYKTVVEGKIDKIKILNPGRYGQILVVKVSPV